MCLALKENSKINGIPSQELTEEENQCAIRNDKNIPLRALTNIWFGTLKIYQQQVNSLFRKLRLCGHNFMLVTGHSTLIWKFIVFTMYYYHHNDSGFIFNLNSCIIVTKLLPVVDTAIAA